MGAIAEWSWRQLGPDHVTHLSTDKNPTALGGVVAPPPSPNYFCLSIRAVVAVPSTLLETTALLAPGRGALGRRGFALESAAARVCREAGGRVTTNVMVRDLDLPVLNATDSRRVGGGRGRIAVVRRVPSPRRS